MFPAAADCHRRSGVAPRSAAEPGPDRGRSAGAGSWQAAAGNGSVWPTRPHWSVGRRLDAAPRATSTTKRCTLVTVGKTSRWSKCPIAYRIREAKATGLRTSHVLQYGCRFSKIVTEADSPTSRFAEFSSKWRTGFSHLRGGSENRTVVHEAAERSARLNRAYRMPALLCHPRVNPRTTSWLRPTRAVLRSAETARPGEDSGWADMRCGPFPWLSVLAEWD
jgi:hypothetical protein